MRAGKRAYIARTVRVRKSRAFNEAHMPDLLHAALAYAARPLPVLPCAVRGKAPAIARGVYGATANPETVRRYWRVVDRNVAIPTGVTSGIWVLDIDGDVGVASLLSLESAHGKLPETWESVTGTGKHIWFKYTGPVGNSASRVGAGIDVRGDGGYVVAPPSVHPSGRAYTWLSPPDLEPAIAPAWLLDLARKRQAPSITERAIASIRRPDSNSYGAAALERECAELAAAGPGGRNSALNRASFRLHQLVAGGEIDRSECEDRLIAACRSNGLVADDGLPSVVATLRSGARAGLRHPRSRGVA
jgi:hypothetical protein